MTIIPEEGGRKKEEEIKKPVDNRVNEESKNTLNNEITGGAPTTPMECLVGRQFFRHYSVVNQTTVYSVARSRSLRPPRAGTCRRTPSLYRPQRYRSRRVRLF